MGFGQYEKEEIDVSWPYSYLPYEVEGKPHWLQKVHQDLKEANITIKDVWDKRVLV